MSSDSKQKVICLGLGRTGTSSLKVALEHLGFGPCHHMQVVLSKTNPDEINTWYSLGQGSGTLDDLRELLKDYNSVLDYPAVVYYDKLYEAYPDAKFILTVRDPAKWETSMRATILEGLKGFKERANVNPLMSATARWLTIEMESRYHQNRLYSDPQGEIIRHNQRVKDTIPADKLLVYEVTQGWEPLVNFLGVEKPDIPFPHVMDTAQFQKFVFGYIENGGPVNLEKVESAA